MYIQSIVGINIFDYKANDNRIKKNFRIQKPVDRDVFVKSANISFHSTSAGNPLRRLKGIICPYFGIEMLNGVEIAKIDKELAKCNTVKKSVHFLKRYTKNMQSIELQIFNIFNELAASSPRMNFSDLLKQLYDEALIKLKLEEFTVLDEIDRQSMKLSPQTAFAVRGKVTDCRKIILDNDTEKPFKRKNILASIDSIIPQEGEEEILNELKAMAYHLPMSSTSVNAFIVKYADRPHLEIARRLVLPSFATIEHIKPESKGGENSINNFLLVSSAANSLRQNMPLSVFVRRNPQVIENCQKYIEQIITLINKGKLKGIETYPYEVQKTLLKESEGLIDLDLSSYKYTEGKACSAEILSRTPHKKGFNNDKYKSR